MSRKAQGMVLVLLSSVGFGMMPLFAKAAYESGADPLTLLFVRFLTAGSLLFFIARLRRESFPRGRAAARLLFMGAVCYVGMSISYFTALTYIPSSLVVILLYTFPAFVTVGAYLMFGSRPSGAQLGAVGLAVVGMLFVVGPVRGGNIAAEGVLLGLSSAFFYALYILLGSRGASGAPLACSALVIGSAGITLLVVGSVRGLHLPTSIAGWAGIGCLSVFSTVFAVTAFLAGLERVGPVDASTLATLDPVVAIAIGALVFGETFTSAQGVGGVLVLAAVLWLVRASRSSG